jgi:hypothetical protein
MNQAVKYPVGLGGSVVVLVNSVLSALVALGVWNLTADQLAALNLIAVNFVTVVSTLYGHANVTPINYTKNTLGKGVA